MKYIIFFSIILLFVASKAFPEDWQDIYDKADSYISQKDYEHALATSTSALEAAKSQFGEGSENYLLNLSQIGEIYFLKGDIASSIEYFKTDAQLSLKNLGEDSPHYAKVVNNLSTVYQQVGNFHDAEVYLLESLRLKKKLFGESDTSYSVSLHNLGNLYQTLGRYAEAEPLYIKSLEIKKQFFGEDNLSYSRTILNLGLLYKEMGNYNKAVEYLLKAKPVFTKQLGEGNFETAKVNLNLALLYIALKRDSEANEMLSIIQKFKKQNLGAKNLDYLSSLFDIALIKLQTQQSDEAFDLLDEVRASVLKSFGNGNPLYTKAVNALGVLYWMKGKYDLAYQYLNETVQLREKIFGPNHQQYATSLNNYAGLLKDMGRLDEAEKNYLKAMQLYLKFIHSTFPFLSDEERDHFYSIFKDRLEMFNCFVLLRFKQNPAIIGDMYNFQLATKSILLKSMKKIRVNITGSKDSLLIAKFEEWRALKNKLSKLYNIPLGKINKMGENIVTIENNINRLEKFISIRSTDFEKYLSMKSITWQDVQKTLGPNEAAIEVIRFKYFDLDQKDTVIYAALILTKETKKHPDIVVLYNGKILENQYINNYRNSIKFKIPDNESYQFFWKDFNKQIGNKNTLYFSPDGIYNQINIGTLQKPDGKYLAESNTIYYLTNTDEVVTKSRTATRQPVLRNACLFGYPIIKFKKDLTAEDYMIDYESDDYKKAAGMKFPLLPGTKAEVIKLSNILQGTHWDVHTYLGEFATKVALKALVNPGILHIATHGYFYPDIKTNIFGNLLETDFNRDKENPLLRSGLIMSGYNTNILSTFYKFSDEDNGILTAFEAMNMELDSTLLVVLSACETGLGKIKNGEGVYGLQRAFRVAGANTIVMSLWKVSDEVTQKLMEEFYERWLGGKNIFLAFREAQAKIRERYIYPYYWGAFIIIGN